MASGLPVVSTDVGDVRSMVARAERGHWWQAADEAALAGALAALLSDPARRAAAGRCQPGQGAPGFRSGRHVRCLARAVGRNGSAAVTDIAVSPVTDFAALEDRWRALEARANGSFFQGWTWTGCLAEERFADPMLVEARKTGAPSRWRCSTGSGRGCVAMRGSWGRAGSSRSTPSTSNTTAFWRTPGGSRPWGPPACGPRTVMRAAGCPIA